MLQSLIYTAQRAGGAIMAVYAAGFAVRDKADASPVTQADEGCDFDFLHRGGAVPEPEIY